MKKYESIFILDIRKVEDEGNAFNEELNKLLSDLGGKVHENQSMGRRQFAREIKKRKAGIYFNHIFDLEPDKVRQVRNKYKLDDRVLRMMIVNYEKAEKIEKEKIETEKVI